MAQNTQTLAYKEKIISRVNQLKQVDDDSVLEIIESAIYQDMLFESIEVKEKVIQDLFNNLRRLSVIQILLDDDTITEIMINGFDDIYIEKQGRMKKYEICFESQHELEVLIQKIVSKMDRKVNEKYPICDVRLSCGSRVNIVLKPIAINGPCVTIRKFPKKKLNKFDLLENRTINQEGMDFLDLLVSKRFNIFISGGTSSGKTTLLNILSDSINKEERIITIEDSAELSLHTIKNLVRLEARNTKDNLSNKVTIKELIKAALRMRPDRIIVGEVRGDETIDMLQAFNTGHDGSISTGHSNSIYDMLFRIETMVLTGTDIPLIAVRQQIASAIDVMVHIQKVRGKGRRVTEISEVLGIVDQHIQLNPLFIYDSGKDELVATREVLRNKEKLLWN